jgi:hypothetical protein
MASARFIFPPERNTLFAGVGVGHATVRDVRERNGKL